MITASILGDSVSPAGVRLTTIQVTFPRFILAEVNTHRQFSRSYRSSRAVPTAKLVQEVRENPAMPVRWQANQAGMQGGADLDGRARKDAESIWRAAAEDAAQWAENLAATGVHKQIVNRVLEPFLYVHGVISATEWDNFYKLRRHADAQPEFKELADAMWDAQAGSTPTPLQPGQWHLPYVSRDEAEDLGTAARVVSAARCARVSYRLHDGSRADAKADLDLAERLAASRHWSPFEHVAVPDDSADDLGWRNSYDHRNFVGWRQLRAIVGG